MKYIKQLLLFFAAALSLTGCLKKNEMNIDGDNPSASVFTLEWIPPGGTGTTINSGLQYFSSGALTYPASHTSDTTTFNVRLAGAEVPSKDLTVTVGQDTKALLDNYSKDSITYVSMPDSLYKILNTTASIKAGTNFATFTIVFYPSKINPTQNYMLAPTVTNAAGYAISSNFGHIYFHTIGNPLAGAYTTTGKRYNYSGGVNWAGPPAAYPGGFTDGTTSAYNTTITAAPVNPKTVKIIMGNVPDPAPVGGSSYYYITGTDSKFTNITYNLGANFAAGYSNISQYILNYVAPTATQKASFRLITKYNNTTGGAGNDRLIDQTFVQK